MTRKEAEHREWMYRALMAYGLTRDDCEQLRRISLQLHSWDERCCNEDIEETDDGKAWLTVHGIRGNHRFRIPNREAGALRRLAAIMAPHKRRLVAFHQSDPRGAALYIVRRKDVRGSSLGGNYTRGIAVY